jgi:hypothetical protein
MSDLQRRFDKFKKKDITQMKSEVHVSSNFAGLKLDGKDISFAMEVCRF